MIKVTEAEMASSMLGSIGPLLICKSCGYRAETPMESDAYDYECECCGEMSLCSAEELLIRGECEIV